MPDSSKEKKNLISIDMGTLKLTDAQLEEMHHAIVKLVASKVKDAGLQPHSGAEFAKHEQGGHDKVWYSRSG